MAKYEDTKRSRGSGPRTRTRVRARRAGTALPSKPVVGPLAQVHQLRHEIGLSEMDVATATGASARTVRRWMSSSDADQRRGTNYAQQIDDLHMIATELSDTLTPRGIGQWLRGRNRYLNGERPIELLRRGRFGEVREAAVAFRDGVYV